MKGGRGRRRVEVEKGIRKRSRTVSAGEKNNQIKTKIDEK